MIAAGACCTGGTGWQCREFKEEVADYWTGLNRAKGDRSPVELMSCEDRKDQLRCHKAATRSVLGHSYPPGFRSRSAELA